MTEANEQLVAEVTIGRWQEMVEVKLNNESTKGYFWGEAYLDTQGRKASDPRTAQISLLVMYFPREARIMVKLFHTPQSIDICHGSREMVDLEAGNQIELELWFTNWFQQFTFEEKEFRQPVPIKMIIRRESVVLASA